MGKAGQGRAGQGSTAHQTVFLCIIACNSSYSEILAALQLYIHVETVVRTQRHRRDVDKFPMLSVGWTWRGGFVAVLDPCWFE